MNESVKLLRDLVSIHSVTGETEEAVGFLHDWCISNGMDSIIEDGALIINPQAEDLLLLGHIDTVKGHVPVRIENGELWGRGSVDAKGPLCASVLALKKLGEHGRRIRLIAVPDEEGSSETAYKYRDKIDPIPTVILEPSGYDGITISYKGRLLVVLEVEAEQGHSGHDTPFSAELAYDIWRSINEKCKARIIEMGSTMMKTSMTLDIRYGPDEEPALPIDDERVNIKIKEHVLPYRSDRNNALVRSFIRGIRATGHTPVFKKKTGTSDMNILGERWKTPIIAYGPGDGIMDHTDEERIVIEEFLASIEIFKRSLFDFLSN